MIPVKSVPVELVSHMSEERLIELSHCVGGDFNRLVYAIREAENALKSMRKDGGIKKSIWDAFKAEIRRRLAAGEIKNQDKANSLLAWGHDFKVRL